MVEGGAVEELCEAEGVHRADFLGHGWGGWGQTDERDGLSEVVGGFVSWGRERTESCQRRRKRRNGAETVAGEEEGGGGVLAAPPPLFRAPFQRV